MSLQMIHVFTHPRGGKYSQRPSSRIYSQSILRISFGFLFSLSIVWDKAILMNGFLFSILIWLVLFYVRLHSLSITGAVLYKVIIKGSNVCLSLIHSFSWFLDNQVQVDFKQRVMLIFPHFISFASLVQRRPKMSRAGL